MPLLTNELQKLVAAVADDEDHEITFALATWSVLCEPGDRLAGMLCELLGPVKALELEISSASVGEYIQALSDEDVLEDARFTFTNLERTIAEARLRWKPRLKQSSVVESLQIANRISSKVLTKESSLWPESLTDLQFGAPRVLWVRGDLVKMQELNRSVALVGSRNSTSYGEFTTTEFVSGLVEKYFSIVSGGAYGIDAIAHRSSIALHSTTAAILAGGCDRLYPSGNQKLLERVVEEGLVISEMPPGSTPTKWRFLQRNRLIAAISSATVVVEAGLPSGAISTANHAALLDRPVGAVPGSVHSPTSAGCHNLIQEGKAQLVSRVEDVLSLVSDGQVAHQQTAIQGLGALETRALDSFTGSALTIAQVCSAAGLTSTEAQMALGSLELLGLVARSNAGYMKLR